MKKSERRRATKLFGGIGGNVVEGNLNGAIKAWKKSLKESGKIEKVYENKHFEKPSFTRKKEIEKAVYRRKNGIE